MRFRRSRGKDRGGGWRRLPGGVLWVAAEGVGCRFHSRG